MQEVEVPGPTLTRHCYGCGRAFTLPAYGEPGASELCCGYVYRIEIARLDYKDAPMPTVTMVYWKGEHFWLGKILEHPEIMSQGETIEELEDNLRDAYRLLVLEDVPDDAQTKELAL